MKSDHVGPFEPPPSPRPGDISAPAPGYFRLAKPNPRIANYNDGHEAAAVIYARGGSRAQGVGLNPHTPDTDAEREWRWGWTALWDAQEFGEAAWVARHFPPGTGAGTDGIGNYTYLDCGE